MADTTPEAAREAVAEVFARIMTERNPGRRFVPLRQAAGTVAPSQIVWLAPPGSESKAAADILAEQTGGDA